MIQIGVIQDMQQYCRLTRSVSIQKNEQLKKEKKDKLQEVKENLQKNYARIADNIKNQAGGLSSLGKLQEQRRNLQAKKDQQKKYEKKISRKKKILAFLQTEKSRQYSNQNQMTETEKMQFKTNIQKIKEETKKQILEQKDKNIYTYTNIYNEKMSSLDHSLKLLLRQIQNLLTDQQFDDQNLPCQERYIVRLGIWKAEEQSKLEDQINKLNQKEKKRKKRFDKLNNSQTHQEAKKNIQIQKSQNVQKANDQFKNFIQQYQKSFSRLEQQKLQIEAKEKIKKSKIEQKFKQQCRNNIHQIDKIFQDIKKRYLAQIIEQKQQRIGYQQRKNERQRQILRDRIDFIKTEQSKLSSSIMKLRQEQNHLQQRLYIQKSQDAKKQLNGKLNFIKRQMQRAEEDIQFMQQQVKQRTQLERHKFSQMWDKINKIGEQFQRKKESFQLQNNQRRRLHEENRQYRERWFINQQKKISREQKFDILGNQANLTTLNKQQQQLHQSYYKQMQRIQQIYQTEKNIIDKQILNLQKEYAQRKERAERIERKYDTEIEYLQKQYQEEKRKEQTRREQQRAKYQRKCNLWQTKKYKYLQELKKYQNQFDNCQRQILQQRKKQQLQLQKVSEQSRKQIQRLEEQYENIGNNLSKYFELKNITEAKDFIQGEIQRVNKDIKKLSSPSRINVYQLQQLHLIQQSIKKQLERLEQLQKRQKSLIQERKAMKKKIREIQNLIDVIISIDKHQKRIYSAV